MLKALKFVQGAVAKKDFKPALTHFVIKDGNIMGYNGKLAISSPIDIDINAKPKADRFVKAISACKSTVSIHMTPAGRLAIKSGGFKAFVECTEDEFPPCEPQGEMVELKDSHFVQVLAELEPFIAVDASRPWAQGILLKGQSAYATNNIIAIQKWMPTVFPYVVNIPKDAVAEITRIKQEPIKLQLDGKFMTLHYENGAWISFLLNDLEWPDVDSLLSRESNQQKIPETFWNEIEVLKPFVGSDVCGIYATEEGYATTLAQGCGASIKITDMQVGGRFNINQLLILRGIANSIDLHNEQNFHMFYGESIRGIIMGLNIDG